MSDATVSTAWQSVSNWQVRSLSLKFHQAHPSAFWHDLRQLRAESIVEAEVTSPTHLPE